VACGGTVGWGAALQARRSLVRFPMGSLGFILGLVLPAAIWAWRRHSPLGASTSCSYKGLTRPVRDTFTFTVKLCDLGRCFRSARLLPQLIMSLFGSGPKIMVHFTVCCH